MGNLCINEIPLNTFLKYFDENTINRTSRTPIMEQLSVKYKSALLTPDSKTIYYAGNVTNTNIAQITGLNGSFIDELTVGSHTYNATAASSNSVTIEINGTGGVIITAAGDVSSTLDASDKAPDSVLGSYSANNESISLTVRNVEDDSNKFSVQVSINGYLWTNDNDIVHYTFKSNSDDKKFLYYGISSYGPIISLYKYTYVYNIDGDDREHYIQGDDNTVLGDNPDLNKLGSASAELYGEDMLSYDFSEVQTGNGKRFIRRITNAPANVQKKNADGYYMYKDDLGVVSLSKDNDSNFRRHQNMLRASYYDIRSMEEEFQAKVGPYVLGCIRKGSTYVFEYYKQYDKDVYYVKRKLDDGADMNAEATLDIADTSVYTSAEQNLSNMRDGKALAKYSSVANKITVETLDSNTLKTANAIFTSAKSSSKGYIGSEVLLDIPEARTYSIDNNEPILLTPYMRQYKLLSSSKLITLPLNCKIKITASRTLKLNTNLRDRVLSTSTKDVSFLTTGLSGSAKTINMRTAVSGLTLTTKRKTTPSEVALNALTKLADKSGITVKYHKGNNLAKISLDNSGDFQSVNGDFTVYNADASNPYVIIPFYIDETTLTVAKAKNDDQTGYLGYTIEIDDTVFNLVQDGSGLYFERNDGRKFSLYDLTTSTTKFSWEITVSGASEKNIYMMQLYLDSVEKKQLSNQQLLVTVSPSPSTTDEKYKIINAYKYEKTVESSLNNRDFPDYSNFEKVTPETKDNLDAYLKILINDGTASDYKIIFVDGYKYYIEKQTIANLEDTTEEIIVLTVYYDTFKYDSATSTNGIKTVSFSSDSAGVYYLDDIAMYIGSITDTYYIGRKDALEELVYYKKQRAAIKSLLMKVIEDPYNSTDLTDMMSDANHFDEARMYAGGLYAFVSKDRASQAASITSIRTMKSISDIGGTTIYAMPSGSSDEGASLREDDPALTEELAEKLKNFSGVSRLLDYKSHPTFQQYLEDLKDEAISKNAIDATASSDYENLDVEKYKSEKDNKYYYYKDLDASKEYNPSTVKKQDFAENLANALYSYATVNAIPSEDRDDAYQKTLDLIDNKVADAVKTDRPKSVDTPTEKIKISDTIKSDIQTLITSLKKGMRKI